MRETINHTEEISTLVLLINTEATLGRLRNTF